MSESREEVTEPGDATREAAPDPYTLPVHDDGSRFRLSRRGWTLVASGALVLAFVLIGTFVRVPYVALGPGPTYDTLSTFDGADIVAINGTKTYPTDGELRMTTVSLNDNVTLFSALGMWASGRYAVAPREDYFRPGATEEQIRRENVQQFEDSQSNAEVAALRSLGHPVHVILQQIVVGSPAQKVLKPGDELLVVNGRKIGNRGDVLDALERTRPGQTIELTFQRGKQEPRTVRLKLAEHPDGKPQGFIGFQAVDRANVPFKIDIGLEKVGGPSAGLVFALAIVDRMTPGSLTAGQHVAGTGEINDKGQVGPIGGISFKVVAAREAGARSFLVPAANCPEAASAAPEGLRLIKVETLDDAVDALEKLRAGKPVPTCAAA